MIESKYKREARSMIRDLKRKAEALDRKIAKLEAGEGALTIRCLNEAQEINGIAGDIEKAIGIAINVRRATAEILKAEREKRKGEA